MNGALTNRYDYVLNGLDSHPREIIGDGAEPVQLTVRRWPSTRRRGNVLLASAAAV
jgi:hypothetical protein